MDLPAEESTANAPPSTQPARPKPDEKEVMAFHIQNPNKLNYKLHWRLARGDYELCALMLSKWRLQSCKNYEYGHYLQAILYRKKGNLTEALKSIKLCYMIDPNNPVFVKELAKTYCIMGKQKTALNLLQASADNSTDWELLEQLGDIYAFLKDPDTALNCYTKAYSLSPNKSIILKLGQLYVKLGQMGQTQKLFDEYAQKNMLDSQILEELGFIYLSLNNKPEALHYLGQAVVQNPQSQDVLLSLGSISQEYGDHEGALQRYKEFYQENQNSPEMWSNLGNCYMEKESLLSVGLFLVGPLLLQASSLLGPSRLGSIFQPWLSVRSARRLVGLFPLLPYFCKVLPSQRRGLYATRGMSKQA